MINVGKFITSVNDIPADWIFSHYLKLGKLKGQSIKLKSIFNEKDSVPSLIIYYNRKLNKYTFKDFSSGDSGSAIDFMKLFWKCSFEKAVERIKNLQNNCKNINKNLHLSYLNIYYQLYFYRLIPYFRKTVKGGR